MVHFFADKLAGLRSRSPPGTRILTGTLDGFFLRHESILPFPAARNWPWRKFKPGWR
jgi:hypothetical protein